MHRFVIIGTGGYRDPTGIAHLKDEARLHRSVATGISNKSSNIDCIDFRVQELCKSRGDHPGLSVLTSLLVSVDVKNDRTMLRHWSQLVPNMSTDI